MLAIFARPQMLLLLWLLPLLLAALIFAERRRAARLRRIGDADIILPLTQSIGATGRFWRLLLWLLIVTVIVLALARPQWGEEVEVVNVTGVSIMVVMDVSQSMNAQDIEPSRLERARLAVDDLLFAVGGENEVGLILFAGTAFVRLPLTRDVNTARVFLEGVNTDVISRQGTAIADAIDLAAESFDNSAENRGRIVVLLTDGENFQGNPVGAAQRAAQQGMTIHAIGYGSPDGAPIPIVSPNGSVSFKRDENGDVVQTRLDESTLIDMVEATGGLYQRASNTGQESFNLIERLEQTESAILESAVETRRIDRYALFAAAGMLLILLDALLIGWRRAQ